MTPDQIRRRDELQRELERLDSRALIHRAQDVEPGMVGRITKDLGHDPEWPTLKRMIIGELVNAALKDG